MTDPPRDEAAEARRLLRRLGDGSVRTLDAATDAAREARVAASIAAELSRLTRRRAQMRTLSVVAVLAAAACAVLALKLPGFSSGPAPLTIAREAPQPGPAAPLAQVTTARPSPSEPIERKQAPERAAPIAPPAPSASALDPKSSLAHENDMFKRAVDADRRGDAEEAVRLLGILSREHARSPLAQTAAVRRFRILAKTGRMEEAKRDAQSYLATYPTGFAVEEARALEDQPEGAALPTPPAMSEEKR